MKKKEKKTDSIINCDDLAQLRAITVYFTDGSKMSISGGNMEFDVVANGTLIIKSDTSANYAFPPGQWATVGRKPVGKKPKKP